ncbi:response regulator transcription factor [Marinilongibacter aquaticus]|uniref:response regulator n=1 Tax=Marinilongibacter aquaticus TaxID=2975157 RepID=UPI0021BD1260|nr:response regulator transcription factor [Marinilongibacter aquaticus]UBM60831.1 response regulator transcription factor [Marinilongibacter aquaticus]
MIRVSIYEDNPNLTETLQWILGTAPDILPVGAHADAVSVIDDVAAEMPDVILMDIEMPQITGIEAVAEIQKNCKKPPKVLMLTVFDDTARIFEAIKAGAVGYLLKKTPGEKIIESIKEVQAGGAAMSPSIALKVLASVQEPEPNPYGLTGREIEVLHRLVEGDSYKLIAAHCDISISTVQKHIVHIYQKLHVNSKGEAITKALRSRLLNFF